FRAARLDRTADRDPLLDRLGRARARWAVHAEVAVTFVPGRANRQTGSAQGRRGVGNAKRAPASSLQRHRHRAGTVQAPAPSVAAARPRLGPPYDLVSINRAA